MDYNKKHEFEVLNQGKIWEDKCGVCCVLKCGVFGDFRKMCHCDNFKDTKCEECDHKGMGF